jgi:hypothetical protein
VAKKKKPSRPLKLGDRVQVHYYPAWRGRVVELRGPLGPNGEEIYRIRVPGKPKPMYVELREDQLELLEAEPEAPQEAQERPS